VIVILGILLAIAIPALTGYIAKAQDKEWETAARDYIVAYRSMLDEAYAAGTFSLGNAAEYLTTGYAPGMADITGFVVKRFDIRELSYLAVGDRGAFSHNAANLVSDSYVRFPHLQLYAPLGSDATALTADAFLAYDAVGKTTGDPMVLVTYGLSRVDGLVYDQDLHDAIKITGASTLDANAGYVVYHLVRQ
jgi:type II secretory pathway pseudopilin PulG